MFTQLKICLNTYSLSQQMGIRYITAQSEKGKNKNKRKEKYDYWLPSTSYKESMKYESVAIITNNPGCEQLTGYYTKLEKYFKLNGLIISESITADLVVIVGCGSTDIMLNPIKRLLSDILSATNGQSKIIVSGCIAATCTKQLMEISNWTFINYGKEHEFDELIQAKVKYNEVKNTNVFTYPGQVKEHDTDNLFALTIAQGCLMRCTYCVINRAYGIIKSRRESEILQEFLLSVKYGYNKIELVATDTSLYGYDTNTDIVELMNKLLNLNADIQFYIVNFNARRLENYYQGMLDLVKNNKIAYLHLPIQHVSEYVLKRMKRDINFPFVYDVIKQIKKSQPNIHISTDLICGFPGETDSHFNELLKFVEEDNCFDGYITNMFWEMPDTPASKMDQKIDVKIKQHRLFKLLNRINKKRIQMNQESGVLKRFAFASTVGNGEYYFCKESYELLE